MTVGQIVRQLDLDERDRICYLFDYCDEWRFYAILKEIDEEGSRSSEPDVVNDKGEPVEQYQLPDEEWSPLQLGPYHIPVQPIMC